MRREGLTAVTVLLKGAEGKKNIKYNFEFRNFLRYLECGFFMSNFKNTLQNGKFSETFGMA